MVQTYQEFKDYLVDFLWKPGDAKLIASLPNLIRMGEAKLKRELRIEARHTSITLAVTSPVEPLPNDFYSMREVVDQDGNLGQLRYVSPAALKEKANARPNHWLALYSLEDKNILFAGPNQSIPATAKNITIHYVRDIPNFETEDQSWLTDDNLDLLTYATLYHSAPFLREDERVSMWNSLYAAALTSANEVSAHEQTRGVSTMMPLPRQAGISRRRH